MKNKYSCPEITIESINTGDAVTASSDVYYGVDMEYVNSLIREDLDNFFRFW